MAETVVLLHGFGGTRRAWDPVLPAIDGQRYRPLALDLRGHGDNDQTPVTFAGCVYDVLAGAPGRFVLCGYSLGGRIAQQVALAAPDRISRLVLVATTAGIEEPAEREERRRADAALAAEMRGLTAVAWADRWMAEPVFAGTPPAAARVWREDLLRNDVDRLAGALEGLSTGTMTPMWDRLPGLAMPVTVVAGDRDAKFLALGRRLADTLPNAELVVVPGAGHGLPREAPEALGKTIAP